MSHIIGHSKLLIQQGCGKRLTVYAISERTGSVQRYAALDLSREIQEMHKTSLSITGNPTWIFHPTLQYSMEIPVIKNDSTVHFLTLSWNQHLRGVQYLV
jgi:hypothetical protein